MEKRYIQGYADMTDFEDEYLDKHDAFEIIANYWFYQGAIQSGGLVEEYMSERQKREWEEAKENYDNAVTTLMEAK